MSKRMVGYLRIARPDHWIKQLFLFPGAFFAGLLITGEERRPPIFLLIAFAATCFIASANYVINEWLDRDFDRFHPTKRTRPVVSMNLNPAGVAGEYIALTAVGLFSAFFAGRYVFCSVLFLWIMGILYNVRPVRTKEIAYVDVLSESVNNAIRFLIGWFSVTNTYWPPVSIVFGYWMGGAFLMAIKRFAEYRSIADPNTAGRYRKSFRTYTEEKLLISAFFYALLSVFFCGIFLIKYRVELIVDIPALCGLFCCYLHLAYRPDSGAQRPEKLFRERTLMLYLIGFLLLTAVLFRVEIPILHRLAEPLLVGIGR